MTVGTGSRGREFWKLYSIGFLPENTFTNNWRSRTDKGVGGMWGLGKLHFVFHLETCKVWGKVQTRNQWVKLKGTK